MFLVISFVIYLKRLLPSYARVHAKSSPRGVRAAEVPSQETETLSSASTCMLLR